MTFFHKAFVSFVFLIASTALSASVCPEISSFQIVESGTSTVSTSLSAGTEYTAEVFMFDFCTNERPDPSVVNEPFYIKAYPSTFSGDFDCADDEGVILATIIYNEVCTGTGTGTRISIDPLPLPLDISLDDGDYQFVAMYCAAIEMGRCEMTGIGPKSAISVSAAGFAATIATVPTIGEWAIIIIALSMLIFGTIAVKSSISSITA